MALARRERSHISRSVPRGWVYGSAAAAVSAILLAYVVVPVLLGARNFDPAWAGTAADYVTAAIAGVGLFGVWTQLRQQRLRDDESARREANSLLVTYETEPWDRHAEQPGTAISVYVANVGQERAADIEVVVRTSAGEHCPGEFYVHRRSSLSVAPNLGTTVYACTVHIPSRDANRYLSPDGTVRTSVSWTASGGRIAMDDNGPITFVDRAGIEP